MKYMVKWRHSEAPRERDVEAQAFYEAKKKFLEQELQGTSLEEVGLIEEWLLLVTAKAAKDGRTKESLPDDFDLNAFLKEEK